MRMLTAALVLSFLAGGCSAARPAPVEVGNAATFGLKFDPAGWLMLDAPAYVAAIEMTPDGARLLFPRDSSGVEAFDAGRSKLEIGALMTGTRGSHWLCERPGEQFTGIATPQNVPPGSEVREVRRRGYHGYCFRPPGFSLGSAGKRGLSRFSSWPHARRSRGSCLTHGSSGSISARGAPGRSGLASCSRRSDLPAHGVGTTTSSCVDRAAAARRVPVSFRR